MADLKSGNGTIWAVDGDLNHLLWIQGSRVINGNYDVTPVDNETVRISERLLAYHVMEAPEGYSHEDVIAKAREAITLNVK